MRQDLLSLQGSLLALDVGQAADVGQVVEPDHPLSVDHDDAKLKLEVVERRRD